MLCQVQCRNNITACLLVTFRFEGEDLCEKKRLEEKARQKNAWLEAQILEKQQNQKEYEAVFMN